LALASGTPPVVYGDGEQTRDFTYVLDAVEAFLLAADSQHAGEVANVCAGSATSVGELLSNLADLMDTSAAPTFEPARAGEVKSSWGDPSKASELLGWRPRWALREALVASIENLEAVPSPLQ
jgi:nucleoside-diphosphate-sugar epimerase